MSLGLDFSMEFAFILFCTNLVNGRRELGIMEVYSLCKLCWPLGMKLQRHIFECSFPFWLELTHVCVKWKEVHFSLICLSWVASMPFQGKEAVEPVEYLTWICPMETQYSAVHGLYQMAHEEHAEMKASLRSLPLNA